MAFQNIATPRMYLNVPEWLASVGAMEINSIYRTLPVGRNLLEDEDKAITIPDGLLGSKCFIAILGHKFRTRYMNYTVINDNLGVEIEPLTDVINTNPAMGKDGFSISTFEGGGDTILIDIVDQAGNTSTNTGKIGSILTGIYYDFPHSPDMNLSLEYVYDGYKETTTKGGNTLVNSFYNKQPIWTDTRGAWELGGNPKYSKSGRRVWSLSFSFIADNKIFPDNAGLQNEDGTDTSTATLLEDDTFQRALHLTGGGSLPFIFMPDATQDANGNYNNSKPDNFAIAKFDMSSFKFNQVSNNIYSTKIKIKEVW